MVPIYHLHIRKTGGTTINHCLLAALSGRPSEPIYCALAQAVHNRVMLDDVSFAGWRLETINAGGWDFAFGHMSLDRLVLPSDARVITCFRDPVQRLASHYRMLRQMITEESDHVIMAKEAPWATGTFRDFVDRVPDRHRLTQLYMFSMALDPAEAADRLRRVDHVLVTERLAEGLERLAGATGLPIDAGAHLRASAPLIISAGDLDHARDALQPEYEWLSEVLW